MTDWKYLHISGEYLIPSDIPHPYIFCGYITTIDAKTSTSNTKFCTNIGATPRVCLIADLMVTVFWIIDDHTEMIREDQIGAHVLSTWSHLTVNTSPRHGTPANIQKAATSHLKSKQLPLFGRVAAKADKYYVSFLRASFPLHQIVDTAVWSKTNR